MKEISTEKLYSKALEDVNNLMKKGENNLTEKDAASIATMAKAIQEYEKINYPFPVPKTIPEILNNKRDPDVPFLKALHEKLGVDGNFILEKI